jgi:hypothetical protein
MDAPTLTNNARLGSQLFATRLCPTCSGRLPCGVRCAPPCCSCSEADGLYRVVLVALIFQVCLDVVTFAFMDRWQILGMRLALFDGGVLLLTVGLLFYCRAMAARDVLR